MELSCYSHVVWGMTAISIITNEIRNHRFIYTALVFLHLALIITNGFGSGYQNPAPEVEVELIYGSPIDQNVSQQVNIIDAPSVSEVVLTNQTPYVDRFTSYLPIHDCDLIEFNATIEALSGGARVYMWIYLYTLNGTISVTFGGDILEGITTISLQITEQMMQNITSRCVDRFSAGLIPWSSSENIIFQSFVGKAVFTRELCPVTVDILTTDNVSLLDFNPDWSSDTFPVLNLTQEKTNRTNNNLYPWSLVVSPIYLESGNYTGDIHWYRNSDLFKMPVTLEIGQDQGAEWSLRIIAVRIDMFNTPNLPSYSVYIEDDFDIHFNIAKLPDFVFIPPFNKTITVSTFVEDCNDLTAFHRVPSTYIFVDGLSNLLYTVRYPNPVFMNIVFTPYQLCLLIYLPALVLLLLTRFVTRA
jgi:hypothetical protein